MDSAIFMAFAQHCKVGSWTPLPGRKKPQLWHGIGEEHSWDGEWVMACRGMKVNSESVRKGSSEASR